MRCTVIVAVLNGILRLHNKPMAVVHSVHRLTGPKKKKQQLTTPFLYLTNFHYSSLLFFQGLQFYHRLGSLEK